MITLTRLALIPPLDQGCGSTVGDAAYNVGDAADKRRQQFGKEGKTHVGTRPSQE
jgi:hypothetical protein